MKTQLIDALLALKCLQVKPNEPFTYASGLKGPLYCDNRLSLSDPKARSLIADLFAEQFKKDFAKVDEIDAIMGVATAGIPHGMLLADRLDLPFMYVRSAAKGHGRKNLIEGKWQEGTRVLMVEDLINQGSSINKAKENIEEAGGVVKGCYSIVSYEFYKPAAGFHVHSLVSFSDLVSHCLNTSYLSEDEAKIVEKWHANPTQMYS